MKSLGFLALAGLAVLTTACSSDKNDCNANYEIRLQAQQVYSKAGPFYASKGGADFVAEMEISSKVDKSQVETRDVTAEDGYSSLLADYRGFEIVEMNGSRKIGYSGHYSALIPAAGSVGTDLFKIVTDQFDAKKDRLDRMVQADVAQVCGSELTPFLEEASKGSADKSIALVYVAQVKIEGSRVGNQGGGAAYDSSPEAIEAMLNDDDIFRIETAFGGGSGGTLSMFGNGRSGGSGPVSSDRSNLEREMARVEALKRMIVESLEIRLLLAQAGVNDIYVHNPYTRKYYLDKASVDRQRIYEPETERVAAWGSMITLSLGLDVTEERVIQALESYLDSDAHRNVIHRYDDEL